MKKKEPIRVAQIIGKMCAGGVENVVFNYYREINKENIQFDFYYSSDSTVKPPQELIDLGAEFIEIPSYKYIFSYLKKLFVEFKKRRYKIVHSHMNTLSVFPLFVAFCCKTPIRIAHSHSVPDGKEWKRNILKYILRPFSKIFATEFCACSEKAGKWQFGQKYRNNEVYIIKNAVDFSKYSQDLDYDLKNKYPEKGKNLILGHVGRFTYAKNHHFLIELFEKIHEKIPNSYLILIGDGELYDNIFEMIKEKKIDKNVIMLGKISDTSKYYKLFDVVVMPSIFEGLSLTVIESQASGIPVVAANAIPEEAIISDAVKRLDLSESVQRWSEEIIKISKKNVELNDKKIDYDIKVQSLLLEKWYYEKIKNKGV